MVLNLAPRRIGLIGFAGVNGLHLMGAAELFTAAALDDGYGGRISCYEVLILGLKSAPFRTESGLLFRPQTPLRAAPELDTIVLPDGPGLRDPAVSGKIASWLKSRAATTRRLTALGNGVYALAQTGLLDGREVTTHWRYARDLAERFPKLRVNHKQAFVQDGPYATAGGGLTAGLDLARQLVTEDFGPQMALSLEREIATRSEPAMEQMGKGATSYFSNQAEERFAELVAWMLRNLAEDLTVPVLARRACMCTDGFRRTFKSVFGTTPARFVENLRLHEARRRLSTSRRTLQSVAHSVGFRDPGAFGKAFERRFGVRPAAPSRAT